jgi:PilZ domain-containing protein
MLEEKRAQHRLEMDLPVVYKDSKHQTAIAKGAITCNISDSGICFYTGTFYEKGTKLQVVLPACL